MQKSGDARGVQSIRRKPRFGQHAVSSLASQYQAATAAAIDQMEKYQMRFAK